MLIDRSKVELADQVPLGGLIRRGLSLGTTGSNPIVFSLEIICVYIYIYV